MNRVTFFIYRARTIIALWLYGVFMPKNELPQDVQLDAFRYKLAKNPTVKKLTRAVATSLPDRSVDHPGPGSFNPNGDTEDWRKFLDSLPHSTGDSKK